MSGILLSFVGASFGGGATVLVIGGSFSESPMAVTPFGG